MKKTQETITRRNLDEYENDVNLYRLVSGGKNKGLQILRKIVDKIHSDSYSSPGTKIPSILIHGKEGTRLHALALLNSLCITDIRECDSKFFDSGMSSKEVFEDSLFGSAHLITNIEQLRPAQETTIWRFLKFGRCLYNNFVAKTKEYIHCNGMIILTAKDVSKVSSTILAAVDYKVEIEPYTQEQLELIIHMKLRFCGIDYDDEKVLAMIIEFGVGNFQTIMDLLKICELIIKSDGEELTPKLVQKASRLL
jgi:hypothetical protein